MGQRVRSEGRQACMCLAIQISPRILVTFDIAFIQIAIIKEAQQEQNELDPAKMIGYA